MTDEDPRLQSVSSTARPAVGAGPPPDGSGDFHPDDERFRLLIEGSEEVFFYAHDADHRFTYLSPSVRAVLGYEPGELIGRPFEVLHPGDPSDVTVQELTELALTTGASTGAYTAINRRKDGRIMAVEIVESPILHDGEPVGLQGFVRDITERVEAERSLRESESRYRRLVEMSPDAVVLTDEGQITLINGAGVRLFGVQSVESMVGRRLVDFIHPDSRAAVADILDGALGEPRMPLMEARFIRLDGRTVHGELAATGFIHGGHVATQVVIRDLTERRRAHDALRETEEQLRQSQRLEAIGRLAGGFAHEFNNLLTVILGQVELLVLDADAKSDVGLGLVEIERSAGRAAELTRQLLAFGRRQSYSPGLLDLNTLVVKMDRLLGRLIGERIQLSTGLDPDLPVIYADSGQVEQIVVNLVVNAAEAMPDGGRMAIETRRLDNRKAADPACGKGVFARLSIRDCGTGIPAERLETIFEPFFTTKGEARASGLGLSTVYGLVKQNDGYLDVESELGLGSTFHIFLPEARSEHGS